MSASASVADSLTALAEAAGVAPRWIDAHGRRRDTPAETLRAVLAAMDLPAGTPAQARDSLARLALPANQPPALIIVRAGHSVQLPGVRARRYLVHYEDGTCDEGQATGAGDDACLQAPDRPGYHLLELDGRQYALAVAPWRCPSPAQLLQDDSPRAWGIAAQIHSLRRADPSAPAAGDYGDFGALAELAEQAGRLGADALAVSPMHAMFSAQPAACSPYSPSSRLFLNVLYADPGAVFGADEVRSAMAAVDAAGCAAALEQAGLVDWQAAGARRLALLRKLYDRFERAAPALRDACAGLARRLRRLSRSRRRHPAEPRRLRSAARTPRHRLAAVAGRLARPTLVPRPGLWRGA